MNNADKARQKLVDSMRKSKAGSSQPSKAPAPKAAASRTAAPKKAAPKKTVKKSAAKQPKSRPATAAAKPRAVNDSYQSSGRVWPD
jgi:hypothetical protein